MEINVCICTCLRDAMLRETLDSVAAQRFQRMPEPHIRIVVVDNAGQESTRALCTEFAERTGRDCIYAVEPTRGISFARNKALSLCGELGSGDIVFMDDDEVAAPDWLEELVTTREETGADIVQGVCLPRFPAAAPSWMKRDGYYIKPPMERYRRRSPHLSGTLRTVSTYSVLIRRDLVYGDGATPLLWFDPRFAITGGSDTVYFAELISRGAKVALARHSVVHETITPDRASLGYLLKRRWATGANAARRDTRSLLQRLLFGTRRTAKTVKRFVSDSVSSRSFLPPFRFMLHESFYYLGYIHGTVGGQVKLYSKIQ